ncbi:hypothetical protein HBH56_029460 [Parastagonospora nodorum]|nr:hypothetical protein HBH56_029460 [Parastagonospora nodorum]KAH3934644.1 hypothetical protein HBH54_052570 [Parastagonospora nodorum]KAH3959259.1 hypothetical protein HBH51_200500 [Parastagonospora nodorum]KAH4038956.1 hypothetical protein HBI09_041980 [Parastagonospora nodorum]KAH4141931.1 hypothetical protein HBH45_064220 [Parastagonospora nodorum]
MIIIRAKATTTRGLARSKLCRHDLQAARPSCNNSRLLLRVASSTIILHTIASEPFLHCCTASRCNTGLCQPHFPSSGPTSFPPDEPPASHKLCQPRHPIIPRQKETAPPNRPPTPPTLNPPPTPSKLYDTNPCNPMPITIGTRDTSDLKQKVRHQSSQFRAHAPSFPSEP